MSFTRRLCLAMFCCALVGCQRDLPEIPHPDTATMVGVVRQQIEAAHAEALKNPQSADAVGRLGMVFQSYDLADAASACYLRAQALDPESERWPYYLGLIQMLRNQPAEAARSYAKTAQLRPQDPAVQLRFADALEASGDVQQSAAISKRLVEQSMVPEQAHFRLGRTAEVAGRTEEAIREYQAAVAVAPSFKNARLGLGRVYRKLDRLEQADKETAAVAEIVAQQPVVEDILANQMLELNISVLGHVKRCVAQQAAGQVEAAIRECEAALAVDPKSFTAHGRLVTLYAQKGQWEQARGHYEKALEGGGEAGLHLEYANVLAAQSRFREAAAVLEKSLVSNRSLQSAHSLMGDLQAELGNRTRAEAEYREALAMKPSDPVANRGLGVLLTQQRRYPEALPYLLQTKGKLTGRTELPVLRALIQIQLSLQDSKTALETLKELEMALIFHGPASELPAVREDIAKISAKLKR